VTVAATPDRLDARLYVGLAGFSSFLWHLPHEGVTIAVVTNQDEFQPPRSLASAMVEPPHLLDKLQFWLPAEVKFA